MGFHFLEIPKTEFPNMVWDFFLNYLRCVGVSKDENNWFGGSGDTSENPEIIEMKVFGWVLP